MRDLVPSDERIRLLHIAESIDIGSKRNFGCDNAAGEIIAHWDDDDYSAPERLADQVQRLHDTGSRVTGYGSMRFLVVSSGRWIDYRSHTRSYVLGTSLCYRRDWWAANRFTAVNVGEDNQFVAQAASARVLSVADAGDLMYATTHAGNTSPRDMTSGSWRQQ